MKLKCDFHVHTCLSPCSDEDMTPCNIVNMAMLAGLDAIAVTDHNSCGNCRAVIQSAKMLQPKLLVLPGMELETSEEVHVLCLFTTLENALAFEKTVREGLPLLPNRKEFYGSQVLCDEHDNPIGEESILLLNACRISVNHIAVMVKEYEGFAIPAHIDRSSSSLISNLGFMSDEMGFQTVEISPKLSCEKMSNFIEKYDIMKYNKVSGSDSHHLGGIGSTFFWLEVENPGPKFVLQALSTAGAVSWECT